MHETKWSLPRPGASDCEFSQDTSSFGWNGRAKFWMDLSAPTTTVKALGSSSVRITCGGGTACVSDVGTTKKTRSRTIPVSPGKASQAVASIGKLRRLVPACR